MDPRYAIAPARPLDLDAVAAIECAAAEMLRGHAPPRDRAVEAAKARARAAERFGADARRGG